jgi:hypothetical protein
MSRYGRDGLVERHSHKARRSADSKSPGGVWRNHQGTKVFSLHKEMEFSRRDAGRDEHRGAAGLRRSGHVERGGQGEATAVAPDAGAEHETRHAVGRQPQVARDHAAAAETESDERTGTVREEDRKRGGGLVRADETGGSEMTRAQGDRARGAAFEERGNDVGQRDLARMARKALQAVETDMEAASDADPAAARLARDKESARRAGQRGDSGKRKKTAQEGKQVGDARHGEEARVGLLFARDEERRGRGRAAQHQLVEGQRGHASKHVSNAVKAGKIVDVDQNKVARVRVAQDVHAEERGVAQTRPHVRNKTSKQIFLHCNGCIADLAVVLLASKREHTAAAAETVGQRRTTLLRDDIPQHINLDQTSFRYRCY